MFRPNWLGKPETYGPKYLSQYDDKGFKLTSGPKTYCNFALARSITKRDYGKKHIAVKSSQVHTVLSEMIWQRSKERKIQLKYSSVFVLNSTNM